MLVLLVWLQGLAWGLISSSLTAEVLPGLEPTLFGARRAIRVTIHPP